MSAPPTNPLHLLRALLRECTYLPDPNARKYIHNHVLWTYRNYLPKIKEWRKEPPLARQMSLLHGGRQSLSILRRANAGHVKPLHKVLSITYGRSGRRRRELMEKLTAPEIPQNNEDLEKLVLQDKYSREWKPPAQLLALIVSQSKEVQYLGEHRRRIRPILVVPATNLWDKEMPRSRVKNTTRKWYAKQINHVFPPLPENERQDLRALATGERDWWPILRRTRLDRPSALEVLEQDLQQAILDGPQKGLKVEESIDSRRERLTPRVMRRLWAYIYRQVPTMVYHRETRLWKVYWHDVSKRPGPAMGRVIDESQDALLFGDVDNTTERFRAEKDAASSL